MFRSGNARQRAADASSCSRTVGQVARSFTKLMAFFTSQRVSSPALNDKAHKLRVVALLHTLHTDCTYYCVVKTAAR